MIASYRRALPVLSWKNEGRVFLGDTDLQQNSFSLCVQEGALQHSRKEEITRGKMLASWELK